MSDDELDNFAKLLMKFDSQVGMYGWQINMMSGGLPPVASVHKMLGLSIAAPCLAKFNPSPALSPPKARLSVVRL